MMIFLIYKVENNSLYTPREKHERDDEEKQQFMKQNNELIPGS
jgi:hypothetical protein